MSCVGIILVFLVQCIMNIEDAFDTTTIQIEPRLSEYLMKKKFNKENNIRPDVPEEEEFCITPFDMKTINNYKKGCNLYPEDKNINSNYFVKSVKTDFESDNDFKLDPRYKRLEKKIASHKDARKKITNYTGMDTDYKSFYNTNPYDVRTEVNREKMDPTNENGILLDGRDFAVGYSRPYGKNKRSEYCYNPNTNKSKNQHVQNHAPKLAFNQYPQPCGVSGGLPHKHNTVDIINRMSSYNKHLDSTYQSNEYNGTFDVDTHTITPHTNTKTQRETNNDYQSIPFMYGNGFMNVALEESLRGYATDSSRRSIGFKNAFENQFSYISPDIYDPNHTVNAWPASTRGTEKEIARPNSMAMRNKY